MAFRNVDGVGLDALGLSLAEGNAIQCRLQNELTQFQVDQANRQDK